jgi:hypothetical protein
VTKGSTATIHGTKALALVDSGSGGGTLYVAETGKPLPLRITQNASSGSIDFTDYGAKVTTTAPSGAIDLSQAGG